MTIITKLSATGFKSFAKKTDLLFGNDFNCIIGPNGSGKSNVMDALCFVLGKSSAKGLRAEKSANLIYNGGKKGKPSKKAEVHLFFDNSKEKFPMNTAEVKISRILNQKGMSTYKLNDKTVTRQQIIDTMRTVGIEPDGHNIILQGDIVHFMSMKPIERRELIEEVSGISIFEDRKNKSLKELEKVENRLTEANVLLVERETNLKELKKERDQAKKYVGLKERVKDSKATHIHLRLKNKKERRDKIQKIYDDYKSKISVIQDKIKDVRNLISEKQDEIQKINYELDEKGEGNLKVLQMEINGLKSSVFKHEARSEAIRNELEKIKNRRKQLSLDISENEKKINSLIKDKIKFSSILEKDNQTNTEINNKIIEFKKKYGISDVNDINVKLDVLDKDIEEKENLLKSANESKQDVIRDLDRINFQLDSINKEINRINKNKDTGNLKELKSKHSVIEKELNRAIGEDSILAKTIGESWSKQSALETDLSKLRAKNASIKESVSNNKSIEKVKKLSGVIGSVSELGNVDDRYALAMEVAAGARIKSVVVENDLIASNCIKELKKSKAGVVTFLPLNKIKLRKKPEGMSNLIKKQGVQGLATDLIEFDGKFKNIFDYVFGSTLIVDKIDNARKIGIGKVRMVTMEGDLIEPSGAMIGGFRGRTGIGFNQKEINKKLSLLEEESTKLNSEIQEDMAKRGDIEHNIESLRKKKAELSGDIIKIEKSLGINESKDLFKEKESLIKEKEELEKELSVIKQDSSKFDFESSNLKKEKNSIKEKLISNPEIKNNLVKLENEKEELKNNSMEIKSKISLSENKINMYSEEIRKVREILNDHEKENKDFIEELNDLVNVLKNKKSDLKIKEKEEKEFYGKNKVLAAKRNKFMELIKSREDSISHEDKKIEGIRERSNDISIKLAKIIGEIEGLNVEFEEVKDGKIRKGVSIESPKKEINEFEKMMDNIGNINMLALEIYDGVEGEYNQLLNKTNKLKEEKDDVLILIGEIEEKKTEVFMKTYTNLHAKFKEIFGSISTKGEASLVLENVERPLEGGVDINVKISGNKKLDIRSLSGGEKTMAALAFIFAIQEYNPASFYLLDEVDAALDKHNSEKLSRLIANYSNNAQYIVISHNDSIITDANQIYGVSMNDGITKLTSLRV